MEINLFELRKQFNDIQKAKSSFDNIYLNVYNEISRASSFWHDGNSLPFFSYCEERKQKEAIYSIEFDSIIEIYKYIIDKYSELGDIIKINLNNRDSIIEKLDNLIISIDSLLKYYDCIDLSFCPLEAQVLNKQVYKLKNDKNRLLEVKSKIKFIFDYIENVEREVASKIAKLNTELIANFNVMEYV